MKKGSDENQSPRKPSTEKLLKLFLEASDLSISRIIKEIPSDGTLDLVDIQTRIDQRFRDIYPKNVFDKPTENIISSYIEMQEIIDEES
jgi:hypothetical protein